jgi:triosephosphate isomerase
MKGVRPFVGGNHKMVGSKASLGELVEKLRAGLGDRRDVDVVIAPPTVYLETARQAVAGSALRLSGQNCHEKPSGAFTGETSVDMLRDVGCEWVILGHSERRHVFGEQDAQLTLKIAAALKGGLGVIACVGETLAEREAGKTNEVVLRQLAAFASGISAWQSVVIAYEPVWAIGTGKTATPAMAQEVHAEIRRALHKLAGAEAAPTIRIIYGGSVNAENCKALAAEPDINGFLVGGASLKAETFLPIVLSKSGKSNL